MTVTWRSHLQREYVVSSNESTESSSMWGCLTEILTESGTDREKECEVDQYLAGPLLDLKIILSSGWKTITTAILSLDHLLKISFSPTNKRKLRKSIF